MRLPCFILLLIAAATAAAAQDGKTLRLPMRRELAHPSDRTTPAKVLFSHKRAPTSQDARSIGFYSAGCLAGAVALPVNGPGWQVMRLSRNRNWGHPTLIHFIESLSLEVRNAGIWKGLLVGDLAQPRGGPMSSGHASHQIGLDVDIWLRPMPDRTLTRSQREKMMPTNVVAANRLDVAPAVWMPGHAAVIKATALRSQVERIFVNPAIKKALCRDTREDRAWLTKVRPYWGHDSHFHVRLRCPADDGECKPQEPPPPGDGCDENLGWWFTDEALHPKPTGPERPLTLADLPAACRAVLAEP
jgi:penicillin-insensitive murein endopeptidase